MTPGRRAALDALLPRYEFDPAAPLPAGRAIWLEIGIGNGEHLIAQAQANPGVLLIGCEPFVNGIAACLRAIQDDPPDNLRLWPEDARPLVERLPDASVERLFILFPDPWPKTRHADRRIVGPGTLDGFARILADHGELRTATDDPTMLSWSLRHLLDCRALDWQAEAARDWTQQPSDWVPTRYEAKAIAAGRRPSYLRFRRRPR